MAEITIAGHHFKKWQAAAIGIGGGAVVLFIVWRRRQAAPAAAAAADTTGGTSADQAGGAAYGDLAGYGTTYGPTGALTTTLGYTSGGGYASNAAWAQAVEAGLVDIGYTSTDIASAVGRYLGGLPLTADQQNIINVALGEYGPPPSGALPVIAAAQGTAVTGSTTDGGAGTGSTGTSASGSTPKAAAVPVVSGGHVISVSNNGAVVGWTGTGASQWQVRITGPGAINGHTSVVGVPRATYSGLEAGHTYEVSVQPLVAGKAAGHAGIITFVTK